MLPMPISNLVHIQLSNYFYTQNQKLHAVCCLWNWNQMHMTSTFCTNLSRIRSFHGSICYCILTNVATEFCYISKQSLVDGCAFQFFHWHKQKWGVSLCLTLLTPGTGEGVGAVEVSTWLMLRVRRAGEIMSPFIFFDFFLKLFFYFKNVFTKKSEET